MQKQEERTRRELKRKRAQETDPERKEIIRKSIEDIERAIEKAKEKSDGSI